MIAVPTYGLTIWPCSAMVISCRTLTLATPASSVLTTRCNEAGVAKVNVRQEITIALQGQMDIDFGNARFICADDKVHLICVAIHFEQAHVIPGDQAVAQILLCTSIGRNQRFERLPAQAGIESE